MQRSGREAVLKMASKDYHKADKKHKGKSVKENKKYDMKLNKSRYYPASEPIYSFKKVRSGLGRDNYAPELYTKLSESSMKKYGIDKINSKYSTAKKRKSGPGAEKGVYYEYR